MKSKFLIVVAIASLAITSCKKVSHETRRVYGRMVGDSTNTPIANTQYKLSTYGVEGGYFKNTGGDVESRTFFTTNSEGLFQVEFRANEKATLYIMHAEQMIEDTVRDVEYWTAPANKQLEFNVGDIRVPGK